jgi:type I restriction enzyme S subunit
MSTSQGWLRRLPDEWNLRPLKRVGHITNSGSFGDEEPSSDRPYPLRACTTAHIDPEKGFKLDQMDVRYFSASERSKYVGRRGDIFVVKSSGSNTNVITGKRAQIIDQEDVVFTNFLLRIRPGKEADPRFLFYVLGSAVVQERIKREVATTTYPNLNLHQYLSEPLPFPSVSEQARIARFLDRETARIDQLIEKRELFLRMVTEKKASLVERAITGELLVGTAGAFSTRGGWFGTVPHDWPVLRAKFLFRERQHRSLDGMEELLSVSHLTGVTKRSEKEVYMFLAESNEGYKLVQEGDVVINTMWAWMGAMGVSSLRGLISPSYGVYRPVVPAYEARYLDLLLRSRSFIAEVTRRSKGIHSSRLRLYPDAFLDIPLPAPPKAVQQSIVSIFQAATEQEERLADLSSAAIDRLRELRSSLITAAVTGQIDYESWRRRGDTERRIEGIEEGVSA